MDSQGDVPEPDDDFEDCVDQVNGFMHFINTLPSRSRLHGDVVTTTPVSCYVLENLNDTVVSPTEDTGWEALSISYMDVLCSEKAQAADRK